MKHEQPSQRSLPPPFLSHIVLGLTFGVIVLCASAAAAAEEETSYNGRLLSEWLGDMEEPQLWTRGSPTEKAVQGMGTNAIPTLLTWISYEPSAEELSRESREHVGHWHSITNLNRYPAQRAERAGSAFGYLGAVARSTIPELTRLARTASNFQRARDLAGALASIGPEAVPSLISLATNSPPWTRYSAIDALVSFADDPAIATPLVPMLMNCLGENQTNTDFAVTGPAEGLLTAMAPGVVVPALTNALQSAAVFTRQRAIACLLGFTYKDPTNVPPTAVPAIRAAMRDPDSEVRLVATAILREMGGWEHVGEEWVRRHGTNTLNGITPDFFTNAPPR